MSSKPDWEKSLKLIGEEDIHLGIAYDDDVTDSRGSRLVRMIGVQSRSAYTIL
jgi:hypothetical protein